jgi:hypothetical protein
MGDAAAPTEHHPTSILSSKYTQTITYLSMKLMFKRTTRDSS